MCIAYLLPANNNGHLKRHRLLELLDRRRQACPLLAALGVDLLQAIIVSAISQHSIAVKLTFGSLATLGVWKAANVAAPIRWCAPLKPWAAALLSLMRCIFRRSWN